MRSIQLSLSERNERPRSPAAAAASAYGRATRATRGSWLVAAVLVLALVTAAIYLWGVVAWLVTMATFAGAGAFVSLGREQVEVDASGASGDERHDALTGLLSRPGFEQALDREIERARRTGESLSIVLGDVDGLEAINDRSGRGAGDELLRQVASLLDARKRSWDFAARVGGEEFALLAPATDDHGAYALAERLRVGIQRALRDHDGGATMSFGIVSYPVHGQTREALLLAADQALLAAKRLGANRSVISSAEVPEILERGPRPYEDATVELATLLSLAEALDVRDFGSRTHCQRVGRYAELIARELGLSPEAVERLRIAGILHDVGRLAVPDELFEREGPLSDEEWQWIRSHPEVGARLLETTRFDDIGEWIRSHHERPDGTGYPAGRGAGEVPIEAAILAVADAYEAMTSERSYRPALGSAEASQELRRNAGRQFDGRVVDALLRVV